MLISIEHQSLYRLALESNENLLITGGHGVGKTSLAKKLYRESVGGLSPCRVIPMGSLDEEELEVLLRSKERVEPSPVRIFSRESGKATGGGRRTVIETVIIDELEKASLRSQATLLHFLKRKDPPRILATAHREVFRLARGGLFRQDLLNEIKSLHLALPDFQEKEWGFDEIIHRCLQEISEHHSRPLYRLAEDAALSLESCLWTGNYRELRRVLEFAVKSSRGPCLRREDLPRGYR